MSELPVIQSSPGVHRTDIEWTDYAVGGPVRFREKATGRVMNACVKVSPGCANCYSEAIGLRFNRGLPYTKSSMGGLEPFLDEGTLRHMLNFKPRGPFRHGARPKVFIGDMTDLCGDWVQDEWLDRILAVVALRPDVDWQLLTKRPERLAEYLNDHRAAARIWDWLVDNNERIAGMTRGTLDTSSLDHQAVVWPLPNLWVGTSVENQPEADRRIPHLQRCPADVLFLSCEPLLLGPIDLHLMRDRGFGEERRGRAIGWVIVGGESGPKARPCDVASIAAIVDQCKAAGVPCFVKQLGANVTCRNDEVSDWLDECHLSLDDIETEGVRMQGDPVRVRLADTKGGDPSEWPERLRVRQMPEGALTK